MATDHDLYRRAYSCDLYCMTDLKKRAAEGRATLEGAILEALDAHPQGIFNNELARVLGLESDYEGRQKNYLTYSLLGGLLADKRVRKEKRNGRTFYSRALS